MFLTLTIPKTKTTKKKNNNNCTALCACAARIFTHPSVRPHPFQSPFALKRNAHRITTFPRGPHYQLAIPGLFSVMK